MPLVPPRHYYRERKLWKRWWGGNTRPVKLSTHTSHNTARFPKTLIYLFSTTPTTKVPLFLYVVIMIQQAHTRAAGIPLSILLSPPAALLPPPGHHLAPPVLLWLPGRFFAPRQLFFPCRQLSCPRRQLFGPRRPLFRPPGRSLDVLRRPGSPTRPLSRSGLGFPFARRSRRCRHFVDGSRGRVAWWNVIECLEKLKLLYSPPDRLSNRAGSLFSRPK
jgi:hypothetical protein